MACGPDGGGADERRVKIAFVYAGGRLGRAAQGPSDFFYGARELASHKDREVVMVELDERPADPVIGLLFGRLLRRMVPPRTSADWIARCRRILPSLRGVDAIVSTSTETSFGLALWKSMGMLEPPLTGILCGAVNYPIGSETRRKLTALLLTIMRPVLFADSERRELARRFELANKRISVAWFGVDDDFWKPPAPNMRRCGILAVGNDGRRDYATLIEAAARMPGVSFDILTKLDVPAGAPPNITWRCGNWRQPAVSDEDLRELYRKAACVVVPLKESLQPSGQSVAMQAMMCGAPVVHTKTSGWWGSDVLLDGRDVTLVEPENADALAAAISKTLESAPASARARYALLAARWTSRGFADRLSGVINSSCRLIGYSCAD